MKTLRLAANLTLPLETVTQTIGILAKRRAGKSYTMRRLVEQLFKAGQQIILVDPKGDQHGLRASADGREPGLPVVILGGERADVPLEVHGGEVVAKLVVEERVSVLLDLSLFRKNEVATFMSAFLENLYRLKAREAYRTPMMLVIDEADAIAPQKPFKGEERMLGAAEDIVRRGGQRGIGCTLVTQRSAVLNKNVLTQVQLLVVLRTIAPQDLAAIDAWIDVHGTEEERKLLKASLPSLPVGDAWFWSPGWPTGEGIFERVHVLPIETFDSAATPKPGEKRIEPKNLADVDLDALTRQMAATIEKAKAENPKELIRRIRDLEKQLTAKTPAQSKPVETIKSVDRFVLKDGQLARAEKILASVETLTTNLKTVGDEIRASLAKVSTNGHSKPTYGSGPAGGVYAKYLKPSAMPDAPRPARTPATSDGDLGKCEMSILSVLSQFPEGCDSGKLTLLSGYRYSGGFKNSLSKLRTQGLIVGGNTENMRITAEGAELGPFPEMPEGDALIAYWLTHPSLGVCERAILRSLIRQRQDVGRRYYALD